MNALIESHRAALRDLLARHKLKNGRVFGSMARDDADEASDVDLLVEVPPGTSGLALGALLLDAQDMLGRRVDVVTENALHPLLRERILHEAQAL
ncbi:MAG: nucleotidyltransferase family protein [Rhodocyclaceae bacterium]|nr:nucleotidyltransferase family protein [Rhodocyclaceae bacterium]